MLRINSIFLLLFLNLFHGFFLVIILLSILNKQLFNSLLSSLVLASSNSEQDSSENESSSDLMPESGYPIPASPPGLDDMPEYQEPRTDSESSEDRESGRDPKTTEIIEIIREASDMEGTRMEKSAWVRGQYDQLMAQDRQDNPERSDGATQAQFARYTQIMLDRLENNESKGGNCYAARHWEDLDSRAVSLVSSDESGDEDVTGQVLTGSTEQIGTEQIRTEQGTKRSLSPDSDGEASNQRQRTDAETSLLDDFADTSCEMPTYIDED